MIASDNFNFVCIQIPHTGSTSMGRWCRGFYAGRKIQTKHEWRVPDELQSYFKFTLVRNPYDRMFTWWWFTKERDNDQRSFSEFMEYMLDVKANPPNDVLRVPNFFDPQYRWVERAGVDLWIRLKDLPDALCDLPFTGGRDRSISQFPHKNKTTTKPAKDPKEYFTRKELDLVVEHSRKDFEVFGYEI